jgi:DNA repair ATPase RecN
MQRTYVAVVSVVLLGGWLSAGAAPVRAQQTAAGNDVLPALLTEVRGLRAAMERMASGSTQAQVLIARLQLEEGRVTTLVRRLSEVRDSQAKAQAAYEQLRGAMNMFGKEHKPGEPTDDAEGMEGVLGGLKTQVTAAKANVDRLAAEEAQLTADIATEQQRWVEINQRLDDLERALAKR